MLSFFKKNHLLLIVGAFVVAALLLVAGMFTENDSRSSTDVISYKTELEIRLSDFLAKMEGVGECEVFITLESSNEDLDGTGTVVRGVAVLCDGGENAKIKNELTELICRVLGVAKTKISIGILD